MMDFVEATQVLHEETTTDKCEDETKVAVLKIGSESHAIRKGINRIGRSPLCQVILNDATVSKVHAEIQAGVETAFVSDLRSSNGTKIKDVTIKPFFYYTINDGDVIFFGHVRAEYTTIKTTQTDEFFIPDTPAPVKNRNSPQKCNIGIGNISESFLDGSSINESDTSMIPGTQETRKKEQTFQKPPTPIARQQISSASTKTLKTPNIPSPNDAAKNNNIHEMETQQNDEISFQPPARKRLRLQRSQNFSSDNETNIHEAETQVVPVSIPKRKEPERSQIPENIFEAETQVTMSNEKDSEKPENDDDIFAAATQILPISKNKHSKSTNSEDIFEAETQAMPIPISSKKYQKPQIHENIFDAETQPMEISIKNSKPSCNPEDDIFDAETQAMEFTSKPKDSKSSQNNIVDAETEIMNSEENDKNIYEAETQLTTMSISQERNILKSENRRNIQETKENKNHENIFEMATQVIPSNENKISIPESSKDRFNETGESSMRSNSSRDRLRLSSTPPSSPENIDDFDGIAESQNLLEICETPLLNYKKNEASKNLSNTNKQEQNDNEEEERNVGEKKSKNCRQVQMIPESSESETDDEGDFTKFVKKTKPSNVIEDSSEELTDEENKFGGFFPAGRGKKEEILGKNIRGTPSKEKLEVKKDSPLRLRRREEDLTKENCVEDSSREKAGVSISVSSSGFLRTGDSLPEKKDDPIESNSLPSVSHELLSNRVVEKSSIDESTLTNNFPENSKNTEMPPLTSEEKGRIVKKKFGASPLRLPRRTNGVSPTKDQKETSEKERAKTNLFENSEKDVTIENQEQKIPTKIQLKPSLSLRLPRKVDDASGRKSDEKLAEGTEKSNSVKRKSDEEEENIFGAATQKINTETSSNSETVERNEQRNDDDIDIDLLPTQILDIASSTPFSNKSRRKVARQFEGEDLHCAPTQIMNESSENEIIDVDEKRKDEEKKQDEEKRKTEEKRKDEKKEKDKDSKVDLDDSLARNLGNLLGEEANEDHYDNDSSMMMTQNLVDILRPTQTFAETEMRNRKSSPRISDDNIAETASRSSNKKIYAPGTLGFVDGEAKDSSRELVSADPSPVKAVREEKQKEAEPDEPRLPAMLDDDDIFGGLPEVSIWGTLSNPGSPTASSTTSSHNEFAVKIDSKTPKQEKKSTNAAASTSKSIVSLDEDSPIIAKKSRLTRQDSSRLKTSAILDDSDDDLDYQDLKKIADRLLASNTSKDNRKKNIADVEKIEKIPDPPRKTSTRKTAVTKKASERRAVKLSSNSSSLIVSDSKSESAESSGESRKSSRKRKPTGSDVSTLGSVMAKQQRGEESQEVESILSSVSDENRPMLSRKTYAAIQLEKSTKEVDEKEKINNVTERPKVTRQRRTMATLKKEIASPVASPAKSRGRRTIGDGPGIPGNNGVDHKILFTGVKDDEYCKMVTQLGGTVVSNPSKATVLITDKVRRTYKFLCAVAQGISVVSINWLNESKKASRFLNCDDYILKEPEAEKKYKFNLEKSLRIARTKKLLEGYTIIVTPKVVQPEVHEMKGMVEACGGKLLVRPGRNWDAKTVIISREEDFTVAKAYLAKAPKNLTITIQSTEFILTGILRQEINLVDHKLDFL